MSEHSDGRVIRVWGLLALGAISGAGAALAGWLLSAPQAVSPGDFIFADKIWHFLAFVCLTAPACLALDQRGRRFWCAHMLALAVGSEIVQALAGQGRSGDPADALADAAGVFAALWGAHVLRRLFAQPRS